ncbi:helix-hairpin-helix domain-containing protein [Weissella confusa]|uniref:helix-hairpin-helix domain-containing protein n=1 Tax=Weissella confusa TaxID=1583 RepID=UPI000A5B97E8|nr:helix-hairpin-helix domain-containing protein [Weissella confusa]
MNEAELFILTDEEGNEHEFIELFSFDSEDFGKSYIILGPADAVMDGDDEEEVGIMPFIYNKDDEEGMLQPIEAEEEFDMVEEVMNTIFNDPNLQIKMICDEFCDSSLFFLDFLPVFTSLLLEGKQMTTFKALYYRFQHVIFFFGGLVAVGIGLIVWWQCSQTKPVLPRDVSPSIAADQSSQMPSSVSKSESSTTAKVVIDVKGAVYRPGVYKFNNGPIMADVLEKAGGTLPTVDRTRLNLAAPLVNGQVLYVPNGTEDVPEQYPLPGQATTTSTTGGDASSETINLNTATLAELQKLPGVGAKRAQDIIDQRETMGGFKTVADLQEVSGIGEKTFAKLEPLVTV